MSQATSPYQCSPIGSHLQHKPTIDELDDPRYKNLDLAREYRQNATAKAHNPTKKLRHWICRNFIVKKPQPPVILSHNA